MAALAKPKCYCYLALAGWTTRHLYIISKGTFYNIPPWGLNKSSQTLGWTQQRVSITGAKRLAAYFRCSGFNWEYKAKEKTAAETDFDEIVEHNDDSVAPEFDRLDLGVELEVDDAASLQVVPDDDFVAWKFSSAF